MQNRNNLIWLDMEMTGLEVESCRILEVGLIATDGDLNVLAEGPDVVVRQSKALLDAMDAWNLKTHGESGLIERVLASDVDEAEAERRCLEFVAQWVPKGATPLCGNSIHQDRRFMKAYMPKLEAWFHYRNIDVSAVKELAKRWNPKVYNGVKKELRHTAMADAMESIEELRHYRDHFLILDPKRAAAQEGAENPGQEG